jgi:hypothetical protein
MLIQCRVWYKLITSQQNVGRFLKVIEGRQSGPQAFFNPHSIGIYG